MIFCIPKRLADQMKVSLLREPVNMSELVTLSSEERQGVFAKHSDPEMAKFLNKQFEKAMVSNKKEAYLDWAKSVYGREAVTADNYKTIVSKIKDLDKLGVLDAESEHDFLKDLVADKLGINVTLKEANELKKKTDVIAETLKPLEGKFFDVDKPKETLDFWKAKSDADKYLISLNPASKLKIATGTIGRAMMLASVKSPVLNILSNIEVGLTEGITRRITSRQLQGANNDLAKDYMKMVNKIYQATGYDVSRMDSILDTEVAGERVMGQTVHAEGPGSFRKYARFVEDVVFKQMMGAPDVAFSSLHFADSINLNSMRLAKGDKTLATKYMKDAMSLDPKMGTEGYMLRQQAILDAQVATWTDRTWASRMSEGIRKTINDLSGDLRLGDYVMPFVKTPANVLATGADYAGLGYLKGAYKIAMGIKEGNLGDPKVSQSATRDIVRAGLGQVAAAIIVSALSDDDFVGAYDPARKQHESLRNSVDNAIRVGNRWISTDYLGPLAIPVTAMMYARKYGKSGVAERAFQYGVGMGVQLEKLPGISDAADLTRYKLRDKKIDELTGEASNYMLSQLQSRLVPSIFSDVATMMDPFQRDTKVSKEAPWYEGAVKKVQGKTPLARESLPTKRDVFGEKVETEPWWSQLLFGARVKTDKDNKTLQEIDRVSAGADKHINFTDWGRTSGKKLAQFKEQFGEKSYRAAMIDYGKRLKAHIENTMRSPQYQSASVDKKADILNGLDLQIRDKLFEEYRFRYKPEKK